MTHLQQASDAIDARAAAIAQPGHSPAPTAASAWAAASCANVVSWLASKSNPDARRRATSSVDSLRPASAIAAVYTAGVATGAMSQEIRQREAVSP